MLSIITIITLTIVCDWGEGASLVVEPSYPSFTISEDGSSFLRNNQSIRIVSAGIHYFRVPSAEWEQRLDTIAASGVNTITTYIPWNFHCPDGPKQCSFEGDRNVSRFIQLAENRGLMVVIRPGPYVCAEWEFGGFPAWLLKEGLGMRLRKYDPTVLARVKDWFSLLFKEARIMNRLYSNGGPIIMIQIENEYGQYPSGAPDKQYLLALRAMIDDLLQSSPVVFYSTDPNRPGNILNSAIDGVFQAVDFFYWDTYPRDVPGAWKTQQLGMDAGISRKGPSYNGELYPGWLTQWGDPAVKTHTVEYVRNLTMETLLTYSANGTSSSNFYMFFGGTNFGFWAGELCTTSYDYGAPVNESGHTSLMYAALKEVFGLLPNIYPPVSTFSQPPPLANFGSIQFEKDSYRSLPVVLSKLARSTIDYTGPRPLTMEEAGQYYGLVGYTFEITSVVKDVSIALDCRDHCTMYGHTSNGNTTFVGTFQGTQGATFSQPPMPFVSVTIVVSNVGRKNFWVESQLTPTLFNKGIVGSIAVDSQKVLTTRMHLLPMEWAQVSQVWDSEPTFVAGNGCFYRGSFMATANTGGTLLDMRAWQKGVVFVNGNNIGRFWSAVGPQKSMFVPPSYVVAGSNTIAVFEEGSCLSATPPQLLASSTNHNVY